MTTLEGKQLFNEDLSELTFIKGGPSTALYHCKMHHTIMERAELADATIVNCDLNHASVKGADLRNVDFNGSSLKDLQYDEHTKIAGAKLSSARDVPEGLLELQKKQEEQEEEAGKIEELVYNDDYALSLLQQRIEDAYLEVATVNLTDVTLQKLKCKLSPILREVDLDLVDFFLEVCIDSGIGNSYNNLFAFHFILLEMAQEPDSPFRSPQILSKLERYFRYNLDHEIELRPPRSFEEISELHASVLALDPTLAKKSYGDMLNALCLDQLYYELERGQAIHVDYQKLLDQCGEVFIKLVNKGTEGFYDADAQHYILLADIYEKEHAKLEYLPKLPYLHRVGELYKTLVKIAQHCTDNEANPHKLQHGVSFSGQLEKAKRCLLSYVSDSPPFLLDALIMVRDKEIELSDALRKTVTSNDIPQGELDIGFDNAGAKLADLTIKGFLFKANGSELYLRDLQTAGLADSFAVEIERNKTIGQIKTSIHNAVKIIQNLGTVNKPQV